MTLGISILKALSHPVDAVDQSSGDDRWEQTDPLITLKRAFPDLIQRIQGKRVVDFGCGGGYQAVALAEQGALFVTGVDVNPETVNRARIRAAHDHPDAQVAFTTTLITPPVDVIISLDCFEHIQDPRQVLHDMHTILRPEGQVLISFGPPWYSPWGAHMYFFTPVPWVHLLFSEHTVLTVRQRYRHDGTPTSYHEAGLGKLSLRKWEQLLADQPWFTVEWQEYTTIKKLPVVDKIPLLRELCVNNVACRLRPRPL
jgi:SAM-dependent methyltransferase